MGISNFWWVFLVIFQCSNYTLTSKSVHMILKLLTCKICLVYIHLRLFQHGHKYQRASFSLGTVYEFKVSVMLSLTTVSPTCGGAVEALGGSGWGRRGEKEGKQQDPGERSLRSTQARSPQSGTSKAPFSWQVTITWPGESSGPCSTSGRANQSEANTRPPGQPKVTLVPTGRAGSNPVGGVGVFTTKSEE